MKERVSTSLKVDPDVWREVKIKAIGNEIQLGDALEEALTEWLKK